MTASRNRLPAVAILLCCLMTACGSPAKPKLAIPTDTPTAADATLDSGPKATFADLDTPFEHASRDLQRNWRPYGVATVPGQHALDNTPPAPRVINDTTAVPDTVAQSWGHALMRTAAWERWAVHASQPNLLRRLGREANSLAGELANGSTVTQPDCDLFPVSLALTEYTHASAIENAQYALVAVYSGLGGTECAVTTAQPGAAARVSRSFASETRILGGWLRTDPILGEFWGVDAPDSCTTRCPGPGPGGVVHVASPPALPDTDTQVGQASSALTLAWGGYGVTYIPGSATVQGIPSLPKLDNQSGGNVSSDEAVTWEMGLFRDLAWQQWAFRTTQIDFLPHVAARAFPNGDLLRAASLGGKTDLPNCAIFPESVRLFANGPKDAHDTAAAAVTQYHFDLAFADNCSAKPKLPDGSTVPVRLIHRMTVYGDLRSDPLLGTIWFPIQLISNDK